MRRETEDRLRRVHKGMMSRCYNENDGGYENYGRLGVRVDPKWHDFEDFKKDVTNIEGWDEDRYVEEHLSIDKDKIWGNKLYTTDRCRFITPEENNKIKPNQQYRLEGMSPEGKVYKFFNASEFARVNGLGYNTILKVARGEYLQHRGWQFRFEEEVYDNPFVVPYSWEQYLIGLSPKGVKHRFYNASEFAREHGLIEATVIYGCANGHNTHTRGWQFRFEEDVDKFPFKKETELNQVGKRGIPVIAISPDKRIFRVTNRNKFSEKHNLSRNSVLRVLRKEQGKHKGWMFYWEEEVLRGVEKFND